MKCKLFIYIIASLFITTAMHAQSLQSSQLMETEPDDEATVDFQESDAEDVDGVVTGFSGFTVASGFGENFGESRILIATVASGTDETASDEDASPLNPETSNLKPETFSLSQNFPNPFNPSTVINYQLPVDSWVTLKVYNILGEEVATLVDGMQEAGFKTQEFNASKFASGVYIYKLTAGNFSDVKRLVLLK